MEACPVERSTGISFSKSALFAHDTQLARFVAGFDDGAVDVRNIATTTESHGRIEFLAYDVERQRDALAAKRLHAVQKCAANEYRTRAEGDCLENILARANAAVQEDLHAVADGPGDRRQCGDRRQRAVELTSAVIGDDHRVGANMQGAFGVLGIENTLQDQFAAPAVPDPLDVVPIELRIELLGDPHRD